MGLDHGRTWTKHGKLPFVNYETCADNVPEPGTNTEDIEKDILSEVDWGILNLESARDNLGEAQTCLTAAMDQIEKAINAFSDIDKIISEFFGGLKK